MTKVLPVIAAVLATFVIFAHASPILNDNAVEQRPTRITLESTVDGVKKDEETSADEVKREARHFGGGLGGFGGGIGEIISNQ